MTGIEGLRKTVANCPSDEDKLGCLGAIHGPFPSPLSLHRFWSLGLAQSSALTHTGEPRSAGYRQGFHALALWTWFSASQFELSLYDESHEANNICLQLLPRPYSILTVPTCLTSHLLRLPFSLPAELDNVQYAASLNV